MVEILICDDQEFITECLSKYILDQIIIKNSNVTVKSFLTGESLIEYLQYAQPKKRIILLDIEMIPMDGLSVAKYIRNALNDYTTEIIFVTGTNGYERDLFEVRPSGFISKPINFDALYNTLTRVYNLLNSEHVYFQYSQHGIKKSIRLDDILYFESMNRKIKLVSTNHTDSFYEKMTTLNNRLVDYPHFVSCHRSFTINVNKIIRREGSRLIMTDNKSIPISNNKKDLVEKALLQFI